MSLNTAHLNGGILIHNGEQYVLEKVYIFLTFY